MPEDSKTATSTGQKKLLALDGGGILGLISLGYLVEMEDMLRQKLGKGPQFVLADYFDYIAGNSTGSIIATGLALGMKATDIRALYVDHGKEMFDKNWFFQAQLRNKFLGLGLGKLLREKFGVNSTLRSAEDPANQSKALKTLLMVVMHNMTTDSPWPVSSNPLAKFNDPSLKDCNLDLPLWKLVRASTAAPTYFPAEAVSLGDNEFVFVDGGITMFNNPAFQLFLMATVGCYKLGWPAGEDKMLLVSVGTGASPDADPRIKAENLDKLHHATHVPGTLMSAANAQQDFLCRVFGKCLFGATIDGEIGDMIGAAGNGPVNPKLFTYVRYNTELTQHSLNDLGLPSIPAAEVQEIDRVDKVNLDRLQKIGEAGAKKSIKIEHFQKFLPT